MNINAALVSSLVKIFPNTEIKENFSSFSLLSGERGNFQICISSDENTQVKVSCDSKAVTLYLVKPTYSAFPIYENGKDIAIENGGNPGYYPDLLDIFSENISLKANEKTSVWAEVDSAFLAEGQNSLEIFVDGQKLVCNVKVIKEKLPKQSLIHINWFHTDCLMSYYKTEFASEKYWEIVSEFVKNAVRHGINCILTPLFTPPLDTEVGGERPTVQLVGVTRRRNYKYEFDFTLLDRYVDMCLQNGVQYFELSHLFTQWGARHAPKIMANTSSGYKRIFGWETDALSAAYKNFLSQLGCALTEYTDKKGITDICFIHCSDEPSLEHIKYYKKTSAILRKYFGKFEHIDALSDFDFYKEGLIETPVPEEGNIDAFKGNVPKLWTYYCCGQYKNNLPNRFFCLPSIKNRILGTLLYKYNCTGFLHWGFNFYFSQYSKREVNPFEESDAGMAFPSGDSYVVYPGKDGKPLSSLRQKVFYDGFQDFMALQAFEKKYSREKALQLIEECLGDITFTDYPLENDKLLRFREVLNERI